MERKPRDTQNTQTPKTHKTHKTLKTPKRPPPPPNHHQDPKHDRHIQGTLPSRTNLSDDGHCIVLYILAIPLSSALGRRANESGRFCFSEKGGRPCIVLYIVGTPLSSARGRRANESGRFCFSEKGGTPCRSLHCFVHCGHTFLFGSWKTC